MKLKSFLSRSFIVLLSVSAIAAFSGCEEVPMEGGDGGAATTDSSKVVIGGVAPLSGDAAVYGLPLQRVVEIAKERINAAGGVDGKPLEIIWSDAFCNKEAANKAANKLVNVDGVKVIIGGFCSDETLGVASITENKGVITFSPASSSPKVTDAGDYIFRNWPSDSSQGKLLAKHSLDNGYKKVGVIYEQTDYALGIKDTFEAAMTAGGGEVVSENFGAETTDFRAQLLKMKGAGIDALLINPQTAPKGEGIVKQLKEMDFKVAFLGNDVFMGSNDVMANYGEFLEGTVGAEGSYDSAHPEWTELQGKYKEQYGEDVPYPAYMASGYDAIYILTEAIKAAGHDADKVKGYLYGIKGRKGVAGELTIDENGDPLSGHILRVVRGGKVENL